MTSAASLSFAYIDSAVTSEFTATQDMYYVVDTFAGPVTVILPSGIQIGHWFLIQNAPAGGFQQGGANAGNDITITPSGGESIEGSASTTLPAPANATQAKGRSHWPTGRRSNSSGFGPGWFTK